jgi:hypothetical protein
MSALTMFFCIWAMVALCMVLFIRGSKARVAPPGKRAPRDESGGARASAVQSH